MENIKGYCRNLLLGLVTIVVTNLQSNNPTDNGNSNIKTEYDDDDYHMFI